MVEDSPITAIDDKAKRQEHLLSTFFKLLNESEIHYCVLRNYEQLPEKVGNDVDFFVLKTELAATIRLLQQAAEGTGWTIIRASTRFEYQSFHLLYQAAASFYILHLDFHTGIHWRGIQYMSHDVLWQKRQKYKNFFVASAGGEVAVSLFKEYLRVGIFKGSAHDHRRQRLQKLMQTAPETFDQAVQPYLGTHDSELFQKEVLAGDWDKLEHVVSGVRLRLIIRALLRHPVEQCRNWVRFTGFHVRDKFRQPQGLFVCFIGPDGSGKTTLSHKLVSNFTNLFEGILYFHGRPGYVPRLRRLLTYFKRGPEENVTTSAAVENGYFQRRVPHGKVRSLLYIGYYTLDYLLGYFTIVKARARGKLVIFDRYFYDYLIIQTFRAVPRWIINGILRLLPTPDVLIWLKTSPERLLERKQELTLEQIEQQSRICQEIVEVFPFASMVVTDEGIEPTFSKVASIILGKMAHKVKNWSSETRKREFT